MAKFAAASGSVYGVKITVGAVARAKELYGIDLISGDLADTLRAFAADTVTFGRVLYICSSPVDDAKKPPISDFLSDLDGATLVAATDAYIEAVADFFPGARGELIRTIALESRQIQETLDVVARNLASAPEKIREIITGGLASS